VNAAGNAYGLLFKIVEIAAPANAAWAAENVMVLRPSLEI
jgi:hypothetical protein